MESLSTLHPLSQSPPSLAAVALQLVHWVDRDPKPIHLVTKCYLLHQFSSLAIHIAFRHPPHCAGRMNCQATVKYMGGPAKRGETVYVAKALDKKGIPQHAHRADRQHSCPSKPASITHSGQRPTECREGNDQLPDRTDFTSISVRSWVTFLTVETKAHRAIDQGFRDIKIYFTTRCRMAPLSLPFVSARKAHPLKFTE